MGMAPTLAAAYLRVSTQEQGQGHSLEGQYEEIRDYAKKHGYTVRWKFSDVESGLELARPDFQRMLGLADGRRFQVVLVWRRDRFGRDPIHNGIVENALRGLGVRIEAVATGPQEHNEDTEFRNGLDDLLARREARLIAKRCHLGRRTAASKGLWTAGKAPYGYTRDRTTKKLAVNVAEARVVQDAFQAVAGDESLTSAAARLAVSRYRLRAWLHSPTYVGDLQYDGVLVRDAHPALVSRDVQRAALANIEATCRLVRSRPHQPRRKAVT